MTTLLIVLLVLIAIVFVALVVSIAIYLHDRFSNKAPEDDTALLDQYKVIRYSDNLTYDYSELTNNILQQTVSFSASAQHVIYCLISQFAKDNNLRISDVLVLKSEMSDASDIGDVLLFSNGQELTIRVALSDKTKAGYLVYEPFEEVIGEEVYE